jgi:arylsulfatase A-like enzyme
MVISWPKRIKDTGALREQFMHVIDVVPLNSAAQNTAVLGLRLHLKL